MAAAMFVLALGALALVPRGDPRHWQFEIHPTQWQVRKESLQLPGTRQVAKSYAVGPIRVTITRHPRFAPLGTNELAVGNVLYNGLTEFEIGRVAAVEPSHRFQDGTIGAAVVIQKKNGQELLRREVLNKTLVER